MYSDKDKMYIAFQPFDEIDMCLKKSLRDSLNMLYEIFSPNLSSEDKLYVTTYARGFLKLGSYVITNEGWEV